MQTILRTLHSPKFKLLMAQASKEEVNTGGRPLPPIQCPSLQGRLQNTFTTNPFKTHNPQDYAGFENLDDWREIILKSFHLSQR